MVEGINGENAAREGFLMQHAGEGAKKGSGVIETCVRSKAVPRLRGKKGDSQEQFVFLGFG